MFVQRLSIASLVTLSCLAPCAPAQAQGAANTAQVCAETATVLVQLEREFKEAYNSYWAIDDNYSRPAIVTNNLNAAIRSGRVSGDFDNLANMFGLNPGSMSTEQKIAAQPQLLQMVAALVARVEAQTGRARSTVMTDPVTVGLDSIPSEDEDEESRVSVDPAARQAEAQIRTNFLQAEYQVNLRRQRLQDLNCGSLPTAATSSDNGSLQRQTTMLQQDHGAADQRYTYGENWADLLIVGDPPDRRQIRWEFQGVPGSLNPGDEFTITVSGSLNFQPAGAERGANNSAGVRTEGLTPVKEENAYFYQGASRSGTYTYKVPLDATRVVVALGADNNQGIFVRHCYGACTP